METPEHLGHASETTTHTTTIGWRVAPTLAITPRLLLSPGFRIDGGITSGRHVTFSGFPKMGASWLLSDEKSFPYKKIFNTLRLRLATGTRVCSPVSPIASSVRVGHLVPVTGDTVLYGLYSLRLVVRCFVPSGEGSGEGLDADLVDSRITLTSAGTRSSLRTRSCRFPWHRRLMAAACDSSTSER